MFWIARLGHACVEVSVAQSTPELHGVVAYRNRHAGDHRGTGGTNRTIERRRGADLGAVGKGQVEALWASRKVSVELLPPMALGQERRRT